MNDFKLSGFMEDMVSGIVANDSETLLLMLKYGTPDWTDNPEGWGGWLSFAISYGCGREILDEMLRRGADIREPGLLVSAVKTKIPSVVDWVLANGAQFDDENWFAICEAVRDESPSVLDVLISRGGLSAPRPSWARETPLSEACKTSSVEIVDMLLGAGEDMNEPTADGITPLEICLSRRKIDFAERLLDAGAKLEPSEKQSQQWGLDDVGSSLDDETERSWMESSRKGFPWVLLILEQSFPEKYRLAKMLLHSKDQATGASPGGRTVLHEIVKDKTWMESMSGVCTKAEWASLRADHLALARAALARGASPDSLDRFGWSPLMLSISMDDRDMFSLFLPKSSGGGSPLGSPLGLAVSLNRMLLARKMLEAGFSPSERDEEGRSPLEIAKGKGFHAMLAMLSERMSKNA